MSEKKLIPIAKTLSVLKQNLKDIDRVKEWSMYCGYPHPKVFSRKFRNHFGKNPKKAMIEVKINTAISFLEKGILSNYEIALEIGKKDEKALNSFFNRNINKPPEHFKRDINREKGE